MAQWIRLRLMDKDVSLQTMVVGSVPGREEGPGAAEMLKSCSVILFLASVMQGIFEGFYRMFSSCRHCMCGRVFYLTLSSLN